VPIKQGDRIFLGEQKTPFRAVTLGHLNGERAVGVCASGDSKALNDWLKNHTLDSYGPVSKHVPIIRWVCLADLVRDDLRKGWRERWQQIALPL